MTSKKTEQATFGGGCFWGVEESFRTLPGVIETSVGYMGGITENPTYEQVSTDNTGHAEVVHIIFDPEQITYETLVKKFFAVHDPTTINRQGPDIGTQYRSVIFYHSEGQKEISQKIKSDLDNQGVFTAPIVTEILPALPYYKAEDYHQQYLLKRGLASCHI